MTSEISEDDGDFITLPVALDELHDDDNDDDDEEDTAANVATANKQKTEITDPTTTDTVTATGTGGGVKVQDVMHNTSKPKWWLQLRGNPRGTKGQRRIMSVMSSYLIPSPKYGQMLDWNVVFSCDCDSSNNNNKGKNEIWFELGFGLGDNLLRNAQMYPHRCMLGADIHKPGAATVLKRIKSAQERGQYWDDYTLYRPEAAKKDDYYYSNTATTTAAADVNDANSNNVSSSSCCSCEEPNNDDDCNHFFANVRIYPGNGMKLMRCMPTSSLSAILMTFPDPWPQDDHVPYRLVQLSTCVEFHRVLLHSNNDNDNGHGRFYLATDDGEYFEWCHAIMAQCRHLFVPIEPVPDRSTWLGAISKYEKKGWEEGRHTRLACWQAV